MNQLINEKHVPVLFHEAIEVLAPRPGEFMIDATLGSGGHARELIARLGQNGIFLGIDLNSDAVRAFGEEMRRIPRGKVAKLFLFHGNYAALPDFLKAHHLPKADGMIADLGFSSEELAAGRGFSFLRDEPLDMRYDPGGEAKSAAEAVNSLRAEALEKIFSEYGEERFSRRIAKGIVIARKRKRIISTSELVAVILDAIPKSARRGRIHPATRTFQALRIFVNRELEHLTALLDAIPEIVGSNGRVAIISFHSLEDRLVKRAFKNLVASKKAEYIVKKPIVPSREEVLRNPRSRSAKLRAIHLL